VFSVSNNIFSKLPLAGPYSSKVLKLTDIPLPPPLPLSSWCGLRGGGGTGTAERGGERQGPALDCPLRAGGGQQGSHVTCPLFPGLDRPAAPRPACGAPNTDGQPETPVTKRGCVIFLYVPMAAGRGRGSSYHHYQSGYSLDYLTGRHSEDLYK